MSQRLWAVAAALLSGAAALTWGLAGAPAAGPAPGAGVFGLTQVHTWHLEMTAREWERMQPPPGRGFPAFPGAPPAPARPPARPGEGPADIHRGGGWATEFPWARGDFTAGGATLRSVGVRYKGNFTYMASAGGLKRSLKIDFNRHDADLHFHGLKKINLNSGVTDPGRAREALAYAVFRAAGVPAPRTAFAELTLTVPGKYDKEYVGLYTVVEQVDKTFLKDRFGSGKGMLLKPEGLRGLDYLGESWAPYAARYRPKDEAGKKAQRRLIEFTWQVNRADDARFRKEVGAYLDVDEFLRYLAANALLANLDSFLGFGHNNYLYLRPDTNRFVFIPWDLDLSWGTWPPGGTAQQQTALSLTHPHLGENKLIDRLLAMDEVKEKYQKLLRELSAGCFARERLLKDLDAIEKATKEPLGKETKAAEARKERPQGFGAGPPGGMFGAGVPLKTFIERRTESVAAQLAGKSQGYVPRAMAFGPGGPPPGGPGGRPGGFGPGNFMARPLLAVLDSDKDGKLSKDELVAGARKFFRDCDMDGAGKLDEKALAAGLNRLFPAPPGGRGGPRGGFGPGTFLAGAILRRADADKDGRVTLDELVAAAEALFRECDKDNKGKLDEPAVAAGINRLFPPPPAFGPPGARPGPPGPAETKPEKKP
jgi:spore coat protein CotH